MGLLLHKDIEEIEDAELEMYCVAALLCFAFLRPVAMIFEMQSQSLVYLHHPVKTPRHLTMSSTKTQLDEMNCQRRVRPLPLSGIAQSLTGRRPSPSLLPSLSQSRC